MAILSSHTLNGMNGSHAGGFPVRLINITQNSEIFSSSMDSNGRLEKNIDLSLTDVTDKFELVFDTGFYWSSLGLSSSDNQIICEAVSYTHLTLPTILLV